PEIGRGGAEIAASDPFDDKAGLRQYRDFGADAEPAGGCAADEADAAAAHDLDPADVVDREAEPAPHPEFADTARLLERQRAVEAQRRPGAADTADFDAGIDLGDDEARRQPR